MLGKITYFYICMYIRGTNNNNNNNKKNVDFLKKNYTDC